MIRGPYMKNKGKRCSATECPRPATSVGMCGTHYSRVRRAGIPVDAPLSTTPDTPLPVRLFRIVDIKGPDDCWEVRPRSRKSNGYGQVSFGGRKIFAHRLSYEMLVGPIPEGLVVCHHCDNPPCVNPSHLFLGTMKDNSQDALRKGRLKKPPVRRGFANNKTKLSPEQKADILRRWNAGEHNKTLLAEEFGVHRSRVYQIVTGRIP